MRILPHFRTPLCGTIIAATVLCGLAIAQTGLTTIQDTLFKADGTRFTGTLTIQWSTFDATGTGTIVQQSKSVDVANGLLLVQLVPNIAAAAPANVYTVHYQSDGNQQFTETWTVPVSSQPLTVAQVRVGTVTTGGGGGGAGNSTPIVESAVVGLVSDLAQRPVKGPGFGTGSVAVINQNGQIEAAVGDMGECVLVDGTAGPCGGAASSSQFFDAETPGGIVDGVNNTFTLANSPSGSSLSLYRNGLYMSANFDYTLNGSAITFATGAAPQPADTLIANYRIDPSTSNVVALNSGSGTGTRTALAQVICSANGLSTSSAVWTTLGACGVPASALRAGDRIEVRFSFTHTGSASGYGVTINWGNTTILARQAGAQDAAVAGQAEAGIAATGAQITVQSWGTVLSFLPAIVTSPVQATVNVSFQAQMAGVTEDSVALTSYTVLLYPSN
jgi:hypothetical protein